MKYFPLFFALSAILPTTGCSKAEPVKTSVEGTTWYGIDHTITFTSDTEGTFTKAGKSTAFIYSYAFPEVEINLTNHTVYYGLIEELPEDRYLMKLYTSDNEFYISLYDSYY
ncbi:MAG: hypothetical protein WC110_05390 [Bacteroidales bacterium]|jgi:hypothetical protein|nr:hypothetical protein [Bacteroidales bacterium]MDD3971942.1 hypothetical protein [Clostridia bacterium]MDD4500329.1 hypothetical protein [Bacteroidales bacterium]